MSCIKWFHHYFREFLEERKITIKSLASHLNIDYVLMLSLIHGERNFDTDIFNSILGSSLFKNDDKDKLISMYKKSHVDVVAREKIEYIEKMLCALDDTLLEKGHIAKMYKNKFLETKKSEKLDNIVEVITSSVLSAYNNAMREAIISNKTQDLVIEFSLPPIERLLHEVYHLLTALRNCLDDKVTLVITVKILVDNKEKLAELVNLSKYIKFLTLNEYVTVKYHRKANDQIYSILLKDRIIELNEQATKANVKLTENNEKLRSSVGEKEHLVGQRFDSIDLNEYIYRLSKRKSYTSDDQFTLRHTLSSMSITTKLFNRRVLNTLKTMKLKAFTGDDLVIINKYIYRTKREAEKIADPNSRVTQYISKQGIEKFINEKILCDYYELAGIFEEFEVAAMLYETLKRIHKGYDIRLFSEGDERKYPFLGVVRYFEIFLDSDEVMIAKHINPKVSTPPPNNTINFSANSLEYAIVIDDKEVVEAFKLFYRHIMDIISEDRYKAFLYIKELALKYFEHSENPNIKKVVEQIKALNEETLEIEFGVL